MVSGSGHRYCYCLIASFGFFCLGMTFGWSFPPREDILRGSLGYPVKPEFFHLETAFLFLGGICSFMILPLVVKLLGLKFSLIGFTIVSILGYITIAAGDRVAWAYVGRFLVGFSAAYIALCQMYIVQIVETYVRGMFCALGPLQLGIGMLTSYIFTNFVSSELMFTAICCSPYVAFLLLLFCIPETPQFLISKKRVDKAQKSLERIYGTDDRARVEKFLNEMIADHKQYSHYRCSPWVEFSRKSNLLAVAFSGTLSFLQHFGGISGIHISMHVIIKLIVKRSEMGLQAICYGVNSALLGVVSVFLIEMSGRKLMLALSGGICAAACFIMGIYFMVYERAQTTICCPWIPIMGMAIFGAGFQIGLNCVPLIYAVEVFDVHTQPIGVSLCMAINWCLGYSIIATFKPVERRIGLGAVLVFFGFFNLLTVIFSFILIETKNRSSREIQNSLQEFKFPKFARTNEKE